MENDPWCRLRELDLTLTLPPTAGRNACASVEDHALGLFEPFGSTCPTFVEGSRGGLSNRQCGWGKGIDASVGN
jgi:hypothetical protein